MNRNLKLSLITGVVVVMAFLQNVNAQTDSALITSADTIYSGRSSIKIYSPHKATFYSAILPGLGQAYNKKYWKIPILYAGIAGIVYAIDFNSTNYRKYKRYYRDYLVQDPENKSYANDDLFKGPNANITVESVEPGGEHADWFKNAILNKKRYYKRYRDLSYIGLAVVYVINMIDASVDAHFKTFDVSNDLSLRLDPVVMPGGASNSLGLQLRIVF